MADNQTTNEQFPSGADETPEARARGGQPDTDRSELRDELQALGQQIERTFRTFMEKGPGKNIQREISRAVDEIGEGLQRAARAVQTGVQSAQSGAQPGTPEAASPADAADQPADSVADRAKRTVQEMGETPFVREVESTIVTGLQQINQQLRRLVERMESRAGQPDAGEASSAGKPTQRLRVEADNGEADNGQAPVEPPPTI